MGDLSSTTVYGDLDVTGVINGKQNGRINQPVISLTTTDTSTNINQSSWTKINWDTEKIVDTPYSHSGTDITFNEAGTYEVYASISYDANGNARTNPGVKFAINGTRRDGIGMSGYVRSASGHNEASTPLKEVISVGAGDTLTVQTTQMGNNGTCNMRSLESVLTVVSLSAKTNADTINGYQIQKNGTDGEGIINFKT